MAINQSNLDERAAREAATAAYEAAPGFRALCAEADKRGYRKASISEIHAHAERSPWAPADLFCWKGGLWVKKVEPQLYGVIA
jgi:hypothetical protein